MSDALEKIQWTNRETRNVSHLISVELLITAIVAGTYPLHHEYLTCLSKRESTLVFSCAFWNRIQLVFSCFERE